MNDRMTDPNAVRTRSVPTAAALLCAGHEPIRVIRRDSGPMIVFGPAAREALGAFMAAKQHIDALLEDALLDAEARR